MMNTNPPASMDPSHPFINDFNNYPSSMGSEGQNLPPFAYNQLPTSYDGADLAAATQGASPYSMYPSPAMFYPPYFQYPYAYGYGLPPIKTAEQNSADTKRKPRVTFSDEQTRALQEKFRECPNIRLPERQIFAESIGLDSKQVKIWFQNRRYKIKKDSQGLPSDTSSACSSPIDQSTSTSTSTSMSAQNDDFNLQLPADQIKSSFSPEELKPFNDIVNQPFNTSYACPYEEFNQENHQQLMMKQMFNTGSQIEHN